MSIKNSIIEVLRGESGPGEGEQLYDVRKIQNKIKGITDKVLVTNSVSDELPQLLKSGSNGGIFLNRCMNTAHGVIFLGLLDNGNDEDVNKVDLRNIATKISNPGILALFQNLIKDIDITYGEISRARKTLESWHTKKMSDYVAEFWKFVKSKKQQIIQSCFIDSLQIGIGLGGGNYLSPMSQTSMTSIKFSMILNQMSKELLLFLSREPQYELWKKVDQFMHPARSNTVGVGNGNERAIKVIETGTAAGVEFAMGCMQVALKKTRQDRRKAVELYINSSGKLFTVPGMFNKDFIAAIPEVLRNNSVLKQTLEAMRDKRYGDIADIINNAREERFGHARKLNKLAGYETIKGAIEYDASHSYNDEVFEVVDGVLRLCPWFIDFIKLAVSYTADNLHMRIKEKGCPMMHARTTADNSTVPLMEDFNLLFGEIMKRLWTM